VSSVTLAVCVGCGAEKIGAWTPCAACRFEPRTSEDKAKALALSDRFLAADELRNVGARIRGGEPATFDASVLELAKKLEAMPNAKASLGCVLATWGPVVVMLALGVFVAVLFGHCIPNAR
jgi:hypothetical protein